MGHKETKLNKSFLKGHLPSLFKNKFGPQYKAQLVSCIWPLYKHIFEDTRYIDLYEKRVANIFATGQLAKTARPALSSLSVCNKFFCCPVRHFFVWKVQCSCRYKPNPRTFSCINRLLLLISCHFTPCRYYKRCSAEHIDILNNIIYDVVSVACCNDYFTLSTYDSYAPYSYGTFPGRDCRLF